MTSEIAPFAVLADVVRDLRDRYVAELKAMRDYSSPYSGQMLGALAALATQCAHIDGYAAALAKNDPDAYAAFDRAMRSAP